MVCVLLRAADTCTSAPAQSRYVARCYWLNTWSTHVVFIDWLREFVYFKDMSRKDHYAKQRLGYAASNIFVLSLSQY